MKLIKQIFFDLTKDQLVKYREEGYLLYLYDRYLKLDEKYRSHNESTFLNFINGYYDSFDESYLSAVTQTMKQNIWNVSTKFTDWDYQSFLIDKRNNTINKVLS